jgi:hypothetical protein
VAQVFPLGSKSVVVRRCQSDQGVRLRKAVYIVDGDYDLLCDVPLPKLKRLYRLDRYSIENYLCDCSALLDVISDESIKFDRQHIEKKYDFSAWKKCASSLLADIVAACAIAHQFRVSGLPTVNLDLNLIMGRVRDHIDQTKALSVVANYQAAVDAHAGQHAFETSLSVISRKNLGDSFDFVQRYAPAKTLLWPYMVSRANRKLGFGMEGRLLRCKLARRCDIAEFSALKQALA